MDEYPTRFFVLPQIPTDESDQSRLSKHDDDETDQGLVRLDYSHPPPFPFQVNPLRLVTLLTPNRLGRLILREISRTSHRPKHSAVSLLMEFSLLDQRKVTSSWPSLDTKARGARIGEKLLDGRAEMIEFSPDGSCLMANGNGVLHIFKARGEGGIKLGRPSVQPTSLHAIVTMTLHAECNTV